jgi:hypothetical protein
MRPNGCISLDLCDVFGQIKVLGRVFTPRGGFEQAVEASITPFSGDSSISELAKVQKDSAVKQPLELCKHLWCHGRNYWEGICIASKQLAKQLPVTMQVQYMQLDLFERAPDLLFRVVHRCSFRMFSRNCACATHRHNRVTGRVESGRARPSRECESRSREDRRANFTLKLVRPGFGPAAELPTALHCCPN